MSKPSRNPKVALFISSLDPGGAETVVINLANHLVARGIDVELWHFGNEWLESAASRHNLTAVKLKDKYYRKSYWLLHFAIYLASVIRSRGITVLHSHLYGAVIGAALPTWLARATHVGTLHDRYSLLDKPGRLNALRLADRLGTRIVTVSRSIQQEIERSRYRSWHVLTTVHNGVDLPAQKAPLQRRAGEKVEFLCVARLIKLKRIDLLIRAAAALPPHHGIRVRIAGDGPERESLERLATEVGGAGRIEFLGFRTDVADLLASSSCFVLTSDTEGLSFSILESMAAGVPAIATDVGGNSELIVDGVTGLLIPPSDLEALERALTTIVLDGSWCEAAGARAKERAETVFSGDAMTRAYLALYGMAAARLE